MEDGLDQTVKRSRKVQEGPGRELGLRKGEYGLGGCLG